ncbi:MAG: nitrilase-related carbon-nitrogen hydrolase [Candidatus Eiseniibacteriota bacterium]|jgi:predicted amidohydrolase
MKIAVAQIECRPGDIDANLTRIHERVTRAAEKGCEVVVFPEMVDTGYELAAIQNLASRWDPDDPASPLANVAEAARTAGVHVICGLSERTDSKLFNAAAVVDPSGKLVSKYRKSHLAAYPLLDEPAHIEPGASLDTVVIGDMLWGVSICYDLRFPEVSRRLTLDGAEVLVVCSAWPFPRVGHWQTLTRARAIENQVYLLAANRVGTDGGITFAGSSCIIDPYGAILARAAEDREALLVAEIDKGSVATTREYMPVLKQRREELY